MPLTFSHRRLSQSVLLMTSAVALGLSGALFTVKAQEAVTFPAEEPGGERVLIIGRAIDLLGDATTSSQGSVGSAELAARPFLRRGELLEAVPGVVISQHSGEGKANQYYLRGFNLDHGTDFALTVDGVPINNRTHAHGQGYADVNFIIPELVERIDYSKGPLLAEMGDFSTAGSANFLLFNELPFGIATIEGGENEYVRLLLANTFTLRGSRKEPAAPPAADGKDGKTTAAPVSRDRETLTIAGEWTNHDGPFDLEENFQRFNGLIRYFVVRGDNRFTLTATSFYAIFDSPDQIPQRAIKSGLIDRFGFIDPTVGGESERHSLVLDWQHFAPDGSSTTKVSAYGVYYNLDLFSNFTYLLDDPVNGDQFNQADDRYLFGLNAEHAWKMKLLGREANLALGMQFRGDLINELGLYHTEQRRILSTAREDDVFETSLGLYGKGEVRWTSWFRSTLGMRGDVFYFDVNDRAGLGGTGDKVAGIFSPKLSLAFGPWGKTEFYLAAGSGFHSNDARGVIGGIDPATGLRAEPADALVRSISAEVGARTSIVSGLVSTVSLFYLELDSELVYVGDAGTTEPSNASRRFGVEWANFYTPQFAPWLTLDADVSFTRVSRTPGRRATASPAPWKRWLPSARPWTRLAGFSARCADAITGRAR
jgi:hypothetical protein